MSGFQYRFLGAENLPNKLSDFDLNYYFRLSDDDVAAVAARFRSDRRSIAAIQMLFFRVTGTLLDRFATIPRNLLQSVGDRLSVNVPTIASLKTIYGRRQTLYEHQLWAKEYLGIKDADAAANGELDRYLRAQANEVTSIEDLLSLSRRWLPGDNVLHIHGEAKMQGEKLILGHGWNPVERRSLNDRDDISEIDTRLMEAHSILDDYFLQTFKPSEKLILQNQAFFDQLDVVDSVHVLGHSLSNVDLPYLKALLKIPAVATARWLVACQNEEQWPEKRERLAFRCILGHHQMIPLIAINTSIRPDTPMIVLPTSPATRQRCRWNRVGINSRRDRPSSPQLRSPVTASVTGSSITWRATSSVSEDVFCAVLERYQATTTHARMFRKNQHGRSAITRIGAERVRHGLNVGWAETDGCTSSQTRWRRHQQQVGVQHMVQLMQPGDGACTQIGGPK